MTIFQRLAGIFRKRPPIFEVVLGAGGKWFWRERAGNGEVKAHSETYASKGGAVRAARRKVSETPGARLRIDGKEFAVIVETV